MLKRFLVFSYEEYYPGGGWNDFQSSHDTLEQAKACPCCEQVVDLYTGKVVYGDGLEEANAEPAVATQLSGGA